MGSAYEFGIGLHGRAHGADVAALGGEERLYLRTYYEFGIGDSCNAVLHAEFGKECYVYRGGQCGALDGGAHQDAFGDVVRHGRRAGYEYVGRERFAFVPGVFHRDDREAVGVFHRE